MHISHRRGNTSVCLATTACNPWPFSATGNSSRPSWWPESPFPPQDPRKPAGCAQSWSGEVTAGQGWPCRQPFSTKDSTEPSLPPSHDCQQGSYPWRGLFRGWPRTPPSRAHPPTKPPSPMRGTLPWPAAELLVSSPGASCKAGCYRGQGGLQDWEAPGRRGLMPVRGPSHPSAVAVGGLGVPQGSGVPGECPC